MAEAQAAAPEESAPQELNGHAEGAPEALGGADSLDAGMQALSVYTVEGDTVVRLHQTNVVTVRADGEGINMALKAFAPGLQVMADGHVAEGNWRVTNGRDWSVHFFDGVSAAAMPGLFEQMIMQAGGFDGMTPQFMGAMPPGSVPGSASPSAAAGGAMGGGYMGGGSPEEAATNLEAYDDIPVEASGEDCPNPVEQFAELQLHPQLMHNIEVARYMRPTPVQRHAIPVGIARRDLMACAQTGSGKTGAFLFPVLHQIMAALDAAPDMRPRGCAEPRCLILSPTRELATQIHKEALRFIQRSKVFSVVVYGGAEMKTQINALDRGCHVLVATPGRLVDLIERGKVRLTSIAHLVLDEADRMLDMGFEPQIRRVVEREGMPPVGQRQTLMFSATFPKEIQRLASEFMTRYIFVAVGRVGSTTALITQSIHYCEENDKRRLLIELIAANAGRTIVFVETKKAAEHLEEFLYRSQIPATSIHGDRSQREREYALASFRRGHPAVLVATDVAARGLDVPDCMHVINYELPRDINSYVHRIGRTGRMGKQGVATSLFSPLNRPVARDLVTLLQEANQACPDWLVAIAEQSGHGGGRGYQGRGKFGGRDYRSNAQVRRYQHSAVGAMPGYSQGYQQGGYMPQQGGGAYGGYQASPHYQYYNQQPAQGGGEGGSPAMMPMGMVWQQQQMPPGGTAGHEGHYAGYAQ
ncbi:hypothetical protein EMIHUDRAFT_230649 [Emiliania huxleyi CCMP1516]|uniref:RNA helicase n=2 Tax=Emiliania huxleyi TaxID=2903 RepID=A0A0D3KA70_EMIH1|nr:hypothetical protein EMIHUDRAFT_221073 [Emiliania huxleyi CCMP1516]XP_005785084.1 hypothetical protein EMIHUDRAFT_230649 [Emiliania huxleyi CCMP1516]EOD04565.1 hypothetical protein EMIHUDRAFT_221073 [Emiliania huxleyi CCMP1516]EOD32655.1 hypothetical protein EMIHUDRAFT_230649 [Emiliania huxleyi CCMP1516]|eukprot:XP_005756994.1 hypothetical protein EMIHUDRAFT_221073 [Emiliania huxleyi CCMP1516]